MLHKVFGDFAHDLIYPLLFLLFHHRTDALILELKEFNLQLVDLLLRLPLTVLSLIESLPPLDLLGP